MLISPNGWRVKVAISTGQQRENRGWQRNGLGTRYLRVKSKAHAAVVEKLSVLTIHDKRGPHGCRDSAATRSNGRPSNSNCKSSIASQRRWIPTESSNSGKSERKQSESDGNHPPLSGHTLLINAGRRVPLLTSATSVASTSAPPTRTFRALPQGSIPETLLCSTPPFMRHKLTGWHVSTSGFGREPAPARLA